MASLEDFQERVKRFCEERDWDQFHDAKELAIGIVTEGSELLEHFRFHEAEEIMEAKREEVEEELIDVFFFVLRLAQKYDIDLEQAFERKMEKNKQKYPVEKAKGVNKKYTEL